MILFYWISQIKYNKIAFKQILKIYWIPEIIHAIKYQADNIKIIISSCKWIAIKKNLGFIKKVKWMVWMNSARIIKLGTKRNKFLITLWKV